MTYLGQCAILTTQGFPKEGMKKEPGENPGRTGHRNGVKTAYAQPQGAKMPLGNREGGSFHTPKPGDLPCGRSCREPRPARIGKTAQDDNFIIFS